MSSSSLRIAVLTSCFALLAPLGVPLAKAQGETASSILSAHYPPDGRLWGMAGAGAALTEQSDQPLANPAAAIAAEKAEAIIGYLDTRLVAASQVYHVAEPLVSPQPLAAEPTAPLDSLQQATPRCQLAARCGLDSQWAWGISTEAAAEPYLRSLGLGVLYRTKSAFSLGLKCNQLTAPGLPALSIAALGAGYQRRGLSAALDVCAAAGAGAEPSQLLLGAEYRLPGGIAVRLGAAGGNLTYGIGARKGDWSLDLAHICASRGRVFLPAFPLAADSDLTVLSLRCSY